MIIESVDGKYYRNPRLQFHNWELEVTDDGCFIRRKGRVVWTTARKPLSKAGIKCVIVATCEDGPTILGGQLVRASTFQVRLRGPIPVPASHAGCLTLTPDPRELDGEELLVWNT